VLRETFGLKRDEVTNLWRRLHNEEYMNCIPHKILFGYVWKKREVHIGYRCGYLGEGGTWKTQKGA
jgi:hypothetical protein